MRRRVELQAQYDAAQTTPENVKHWRWADGLSAAEANSPEVRDTIRQRARYEVGNNSFASGMIDTLAADTVGRGPNLQLQTDNKAVNRAVEDAWRKWCAAVGLARKLRVARRSKAVDGEAFLLRINNPRLRLPVQLDVMPVECDHFENLTHTSSDRHVSGVWFDDAANPLRYDFLEDHPGDPRGVRQGEPKQAADVIHLFKMDRPGQVRGVSEITPALPLFAMLRRYTLAVILAAENAADHAALIETQSPPLDDDATYDPDPVDPMEQFPVDRGTITALPRGWKMSQLRPEQPTTTYRQFRDALLNEIARCLGMPFNIAAANSAGYNYASGQLDHGPYYHTIRIERGDIELLAIERIFSWWLAEAALIPGYLPPGVAQLDLPHHWYWGRREHGDPAKHASAVKTLKEAGLLTDEAYLLDEGIDPEEHHAQRKRQAQREKELREISGEAEQGGARTRRGGRGRRRGGDQATSETPSAAA